MNGSKAFERKIVAIAGAGAWGTTLAIVASRAGRSVRLLTHRSEDAAHIRATRTHPRSLPGILIPDQIDITADPAAALTGADAVIAAVPTQQLRAFARDNAPYIGSNLVVSAAKGIENGTMARPSEILRQEFAGAAIVALSGPNLSLEIAQGGPAAAVVAGDDEEATRHAQRLLHSATFRIYTSRDIAGVEFGGALKNIIAIAAGIADGLGLGDNAKASMMTRGIAEMARLGVACGAERETFNGLSGFGDLIATCASTLSRNHRVGQALAQGKHLDAILADQVETAEGIPTTRAALELAARVGVELPITTQIGRVLFDDVSPREAIEALLRRDPTTESPR